MGRFLKILHVVHVSAVLLSVGAPAIAAEEAMIRPWQMGFQAAASPVMAAINDFHNLLMWIITAISLFVVGLLLYVAVRFNEKRNPVPSKTTHNTVLEVVWTAAPIVLLAIIAVPSFKLLYLMDRYDDPDMTLKITGHQWYWSYEYPDHGGLAFDSIPVDEEDLKPGQPRLLTVDNRVVLPVDTNIRLLHTSDDVLHNWAVPAFGLKTDTNPGRVNEAWVRITREGVYRGQCSELCGVFHSFMPIVVEAVSTEAFQAWVETAKEEFASTDGIPGGKGETGPVLVARAAGVAR